MDDQIVTIMRGLPGSGKTTWAKQQLLVDPDIVRVSKDDLRDMLWGGYRENGEGLVIRMRDALIVRALQSGLHVIVDDTNLNPAHAERIRALAHRTIQNVRVNLCDLTDVSIFECIRRDALRAQVGHRSVGAEVIRDMARKWLAAPA